MACIKCGQEDNLMNLYFHFGNVSTSTRITGKTFNPNTLREAEIEETTTRYSFSQLPDVYHVCETCANQHYKKKQRIDYIKAALAVLMLIAAILLIIFTSKDCIIGYIIMIISSLVILYKTFSGDRISDLGLAIFLHEREKGLEPDINKKYIQAAAEDIILTLFEKGEIKKDGCRNMITDVQYYNIMKKK